MYDELRYYEFRYYEFRYYEFRCYDSIQDEQIRDIYPNEIVVKNIPKLRLKESIKLQHFTKVCLDRTNHSAENREHGVPTTVEAITTSKHWT